MSEMGLEERCEEDMHVSTARIPIIREHPLDISEGDSLEDSKIIAAVRQSQLPRTIYAPIGDAEFWIEIHLGLVAYALRAAEQSMLEKHIEEARIVLIQNDLYRQFRDKVHLSNELAAKQDQIDKERKEHLSMTANILTRYINLIYLFGIEKDRHDTEVQLLSKEHELSLQLFGLHVSNEIEAKELVIKMYEGRFGSREELMKLAKAEENSRLPGMLGPRKYADISTYVKQHETGKQPKTIGQQMVDCFEKLFNPDTYGNIARAVYRAFRKEDKK